MSWKEMRDACHPRDPLFWICDMKMAEESLMTKDRHEIPPPPNIPKPFTSEGISDPEPDREIVFSESNRRAARIVKVAAVAVVAAFILGWLVGRL